MGYTLAFTMRGPRVENLTDERPKEPVKKSEEKPLTKEDTATQTKCILKDELIKIFVKDFRSRVVGPSVHDFYHAAKAKRSELEQHPTQQQQQQQDQQEQQQHLEREQQEKTTREHSEKQVGDRPLRGDERSRDTRSPSIAPEPPREPEGALPDLSKLPRIKKRRSSPAPDVLMRSAPKRHKIESDDDRETRAVHRASATSEDDLSMSPIRRQSSSSNSNSNNNNSRAPRRLRDYLSDDSEADREQLAYLQQLRRVPPTTSQREEADNGRHWSLQQNDEDDEGQEEDMEEEEEVESSTLSAVGSEAPKGRVFDSSSEDDLMPVARAPRQKRRRLQDTDDEDELVEEGDEDNGRQPSAERRLEDADKANGVMEPTRLPVPNKVKARRKKTTPVSAPSSAPVESETKKQLRVPPKKKEAKVDLDEARLERHRSEQERALLESSGSEDEMETLYDEEGETPEWDPFQHVQDGEDFEFLRMAIMEKVHPNGPGLVVAFIKENKAAKKGDGCARARGYYPIPDAVKATYLPKNKAVFDPAAATGRMTSRTTRVNNRRLLVGMDMQKKTIADSDILKFNQLKSRKKQLRFAKSPIHDWGLFAEEHIDANDMVIEYVGEIIRQQVAEEREKKYERCGIGSSYLFRVDDDTVIDATKKGSIARFINHCCTVCMKTPRRMKRH